MAKVIITKALRDEVIATLNSEAEAVFSRMKQLEAQPARGKPVGHVGKVVIKEIKHSKFRFYCITDGHTLKFGTTDELAALIVKFVRMSEKKDQQKTIEEIKRILKTMGFQGV
jgi:predicted Zn-ribbon and HTH transcriptional regulator